MTIHASVEAFTTRTVAGCANPGKWDSVAGSNQLLLPWVEAKPIPINYLYKENTIQYPQPNKMYNTVYNLVS